MKKYIESQNVEVVEQEQADKLSLEWHQLYCPKRLSWAKSRPSRGFRWEDMKCGIEGDEAFKEYQEHVSRAYYIMPELYGTKDVPMYVSSDKPFNINVIPKIDCYVFPKNMAWTMAFTHEAGWLGPYFTKHRDYKKLQDNNVQSYNAKY